MCGKVLCAIRRSASLPVALIAMATVLAGTVPAIPVQDRTQSIEQTQRLEGEAVLKLADAAFAGRTVPADFRIAWQNAFLKARHGTFVPFTLTIDSSRLTRPAALIYVRAVRRGSSASARRREENSGGQSGVDEFPLDAIFPADLKPEPGQLARVHRGFSIAPGEYDLCIVVRERVDPAQPRTEPKSAVLKQPLSVPDFTAAGLTTSTVLVAERLDLLAAPLGPEELAERPYVIGQHDITPAADRRFRRNEELIVVFLVYGPMVRTDGKFDLQVEYHFYLKGHVKAGAASGTPPPPHPAEREGEQYFNHTDPQRFNTEILGAGFDAKAHPVMAGQGVPLAGFQEGEYRLAIKVTDLLAGTSILRDVFFTVGS